MSWNIKITKQVLHTGEKLFFTDRTGVYDINNQGGWGGENGNRSDIALLFYAKRIPYKGDPEILSKDVAFIDYNPEYENDHQSVFEIPYNNDGWYQVWFIALPLEYEIPEQGNIRYNVNTQDIEIYQEEEWVKLEIEDIESKLLVEGYDFGFTEEIYLVKLIKQSNCALENYIDCIKCSSCKCDKHFREYEELKVTIQAIDYLFYSNKPFEAVRIAELNNRKFRCCK